MPNHPIVVSGAIVVVSVAVAAAIAVYESPQARQFAEDVRRKIAMALHSLGDEINPQPQQPRFNRPEDAEGFMQSTGGAEAGVDADEESRRRQREELMYWNAVHLEKKTEERKMPEKRPANKSRGSSFDDFLQQDANAEKGTYVYNTGADIHENADEGLTHRRGASVRGLNAGSVYANPFGDEHNIDWDEQRAVDASLMSPEASEKVEDEHNIINWDEQRAIDAGLMSPEAPKQAVDWELQRAIDASLASPEEFEKTEVMSDDLYTASPRPRFSSRVINVTEEEPLVDTSEPVPDPPVSYPTIEEIMQQETYTNMAHPENVFASIHAWANNANNAFYSPLPASPDGATPQQQEDESSHPAVYDDPDISVPGSGQATPTDSGSINGSGENVWAPRSGATSDADVMSIDGEGISTPGSWTEVGSVVSENDVGIHH
ncbi:hypothetical protein B7494_g1636 [Chlorociboria aeruginascens]|nr:hypothetical protein B7494_g1636 [Chlorociboria aeruginascens]